ncbi:hypothetical protein CBZ_00840 [Cellulomonas biazotea]|uniref:Uncharacterized protein n=1 Tax=Cellulomonas biazotea TaxID=1709 RepID=A0A402DLR8_9CELL|nr:hypothetical protein CBZ_00840 [Cellulomonas biazotea]
MRLKIGSPDEPSAAITMTVIPGTGAPVTESRTVPRTVVTHSAADAAAGTSPAHVAATTAAVTTALPLSRTTPPFANPDARPGRRTR